MRVCLMVFVSAAFAVGSARAQIGEKAPEFPPGFFTDGGKYQLADFRGRATAIYFFDPLSPGVQENVPEKNALVQQYKGKAVSFFGVAVLGTPAQAVAFGQTTSLEMPIFADTMGLLQRRYGLDLMANQYAMRLLDIDGKFVSGDFKKESFEKALVGANESIFKELDLKGPFMAVAAPFDLGQFPAGMKQLQFARKSVKKADQATLDKMQEAVKKEAVKWKSEADQAGASAPIVAYDLYAKVAATLPNDELGKASQTELRRLADVKNLKAELTARAAFNKVVTAMNNSAPNQKKAIGAAFADVGKKHRDTPTGTKASLLADELGYEPPMPKKK